MTNEFYRLYATVAIAAFLAVAAMSFFAPGGP